MIAPLYGENLVRLLYLDEAGTSADATSLTVAGVLVHGDRQWPKIEGAIVDLIDKYVTPSQRLGFVFHATDIFHGRRYWRTVEPAARFSALMDLARVIDDLALPVVVGGYQKDDFGRGVLDVAEQVRDELKGTVFHGAAAIDCLVRADRWLERFAPRELATVVHEDGPKGKRFIQRCVEILRSEESMEAEGLHKEVRQELRLPLRRIIDTVHFATKAGARPLQLADLCAFVFGRFRQDKSVPREAFELLWKRVRWLMPPKHEILREFQEEAIAAGEVPSDLAEFMRQSRARREARSRPPSRRWR